MLRVKIVIFEKFSHSNSSAIYRYRGLVVSMDPLKVLFVDWGNTEEFSSIDDIKVLPEKFCKYPPMVSFFCQVN